MLVAAGRSWHVTSHHERVDLSSGVTGPTHPDPAVVEHVTSPCVHLFVGKHVAAWYIVVAVRGTVVRHRELSVELDADPTYCEGRAWPPRPTERQVRP